MGFFSTCHESSGRTTLFGGRVIMMCGKTMPREESNDGWRPGGSRNVDCPGCLRAMGRKR
jgi:hypothetical protein